MARADLLKKLFSSFNNDDRELFIKTAHEIIADERKKNHSILANDLERVLNGAKKQYRYSMPTMKTVVAQNTDKEARLVEIVYPDKYFDDVILPREKVLQLEEVIREFQNWDILISNGVAPINKLLFYGPPGCGKTLCASILAAEIGIPLMYIRFDALVSSYLGETASNIGKVFDLAKNDSFVILFDEFDAIGRSRNDATEHGEIKRVVNTFLQQLDNFKGRSIIIAATNFEQSLDYAIWRRFDDTIRFDLPSNDEKIKLFALRLTQFNGPAHAFETFLGATKNFSHADVENVCKTIMRKCILTGKRNYSKKDIEIAVEKQAQMVALRKSQY
jgi:AAA+ superfamily predicted ATPase